jgi:hypothetical protein
LRFVDGFSLAAEDAIGFGSCFVLVKLFVLIEMEVTIRNTTYLLPTFWPQPPHAQCLQRTVQSTENSATGLYACTTMPNSR